MFRKLLFVFFLSTASTICGQFSNIQGTPLVKNFTEEDTNSDLTVFDISQSANGLMYFATSNGLKEFDGVRWKNYKLGIESDLRSVLYKDDQHIYTSGHGGFGYWHKNDKGLLEYTSLFFKQPTKQAPLLPTFSRIKEIEGKIIFQTFQQVFIYDPTTNKLETIQANKGFNLLLSSKNRVFIQDTRIGLFELKGSEFVLLEGTDKQDLHIINVFVKNKDELLIATKRKGFWSWKDKRLSKTKWEVNAFIKEHVANDIVAFRKDKFIVGTLRNGIYVVSAQGKILMNQSKSNGLLENTVRKIFADLNDNIWLGMEKGLTYLEASSNTSCLFDYKGDFGTVYTSHVKNSSLYLGTNQGLFMKNGSLSNSKLNLIDNSIGQIWEIEEIDDQILVGSHEGVSVIENQKLKLLLKEGGAWVFKKHPKLKNVLYVGFYSGIAVFKLINGNWVFEKKWSNYGESSRFMEFDKYGDLWVTHPAKGYYRLNLSDDGINLKDFEFYGVNNTAVETYAYICKIDDDLVFYNPKGYFSFDPIDNTFVPKKYASQLFKNIKGINSIVQKGNIFWYSTPKSLGYIVRDRDRFKNVQSSFYSIRNKHLNDFNKFEKLNDSVFGIGIHNGLVFHTIKNVGFDSKKQTPLLRSLEFISKTDTITKPIYKKELDDIPNGNNFLRVTIASPKTPFLSSSQIQYRLIGLNEEWSNWEFVSELNFPGLSAGKYVLELRSGGENENISKTISRAFYVKSPWYLTKVAFAFYLLFFLVINVLYRRYFKKKSQKQIKDLKQAEENKRKYQEEVFKMDRLETEKEMLILREENLNLEIKKKNSALASSTLNNIKKNELLTDLIKDIKNIDAELMNSSLHYPVKKVIKKINNHLVDKEDWLTFQLHFRNSHAQFFENLREKHPDLSSNEIKLCAYLKLNISSKEIASLMNIAITSVEQSRYRLRKKINLDKDINLVNYIHRI